MRFLPTANCMSGIVLSALLLTMASPVMADEAVGSDWIAREPGVEVAVSLAVLAANTTMFIPQQKSGWAPSWRRAPHEGYTVASDLTGAILGTTWQLSTGFALEAAYFARHGVDDPAAAAARTTLIDLQSVTLAVAITTALKRLTGRCRPRSVRRTGCDEYTGFPSGHVVMPSALAGSRLLLALRSPDAGERYGAFGLMESMSLATAAFRMLAGAHSWEDVLGGWLVGHATGSIIALAHPILSLPAESPGVTQAAFVSRPASPSAPVGFVWSSRF